MKEVVLVTSGMTVSLTYLLRLIEEALGKKAMVYNLATQPGDVPITLADISKAKDVLGYMPRVNIEEGIPLFVQRYLRDRR